MAYFRLFPVVFAGMMLLTGRIAGQSLTYTVTDNTCFGGSNGAVDLTVQDVLLPATYEWSNGAEAEDLTGLPAGIYTVTVTDASGSTLTISATVQEPAAWDVTTASTDVRCAGEANGSVALLVSGGTAPYTYTWTGGVHSKNLNGCTAGTYTVTVTDSHQCSSTSVATVQQPQPLVLTGDGLQGLCAGQGAVDLTVTGGSGPYLYYWSDGVLSEDRQNLGAGTYTVTVVDNHACRGTAAFTPVYSQSMTVTAEVIARPDCFIANGAASCTVTGGNAPYAYHWENSIPSTQPVASGLPTGTYTVTITDASGCTATASVGLTPENFEVNVLLQQFGCNFQTLNDASYEGMLTQWLTTPTPEGGTIWTLVSDIPGCRCVSSVEAPPLPPPYVAIREIGDACTGGLLAYGVTFEAATYLWSTGATTAQISNIPAGTYSVTINSADGGCFNVATIVTTHAYSSADFGLSYQAQATSGPAPNSGAIEILHGESAALPLAFQWSNGAVTSAISNLASGTYTATVSDANGCTQTVNALVPAPGTPVITIDTIKPTDCQGRGAIDISVNGGAPPYTFTWSNGNTTEDLASVYAGAYSVTVTDGNGLESQALFNVPVGPVFTVAIEPVLNECSSIVLQANISGTESDLAYSWTGPDGLVANTPIITVHQEGNYYLTVVSAGSCLRTASYMVDSQLFSACGVVEGVVVYDLNSNCGADIAEPSLAGWLVRATSATDVLYGATNAQGRYHIYAPEGDYIIEALPLNGLWATCGSTPSVALTVGSTVQADTIPVKAQIACPALSVSIGTALLRRCFGGNHYAIQYCNQGTIAAPDAYIVVDLDPFLTPLAASQSYVDLGDGMLRFDLGDLAVGACGSLDLEVEVGCSAVFGQTHCTTAHIYPDENCIPPNPSWSGASLLLTGACNPDSVRFTIKNIGIGDMQSSSDYIVVEDAVMLRQESFQLNSGDSTIVAVPTNGSTWWMQLDQAPLHPGHSAPAVSVEGCSTDGTFSTGYVTQFANDDADPWIDIDCTQNIGSYDPNDKQGFPVGYGPEHYIRPGTELEYMIRFQNTGTDTAFTVRVADTLSAWLDPATIRPTVSSHPYQFNLTGPGIAEFLFENIMLPDSNVNQAASNGFVKFSIYPKADAPLETLIENSAAIYFDFNEPVITNTTRHRLGENFLTVGLWMPQRPQYEVLVSPNPFGETARLEVKGLDSALPIHLQVIDLQGEIVRDETSAGTTILLKKGSLPAGMYLFKIDQKGALVGSGKLVVKE